MKPIKKLLSNIHRYILWLLLSVIFWAWIFTAVTDTVSSKKVVIYANVPAIREYELAEELEKTKPEGIRMIKVRSAEYSGFDASSLDEADIFILSASDIEANTERLSPIVGFEGEKLLFVGDEAYGICVFDPESGTECASRYIDYSIEGVPTEGYYICFNIRSTHTEKLNGSKDNAALLAAEELLRMND